MDGISQSV